MRKLQLALHYLFFLAMISLSRESFGQNKTTFLTIKSPAKETSSYSAGRQFVTGLTCKTCLITINGNAVPVYTTGAFAFELKLNTSDTTIEVKATDTDGKQVTRKLFYTYVFPRQPLAVSALAIESIQTFPTGNLTLRAGDRIQIKVKALPGATVSTYNNMPLYEMPLTLTDSMPGIYQGEYEIKAADNFSNMKFPVQLTDSAGRKVTKETSNTFSIISSLASDIAITKGRLAHLKYGLGTDRS